MFRKSKVLWAFMLALALCIGLFPVALATITTNDKGAIEGGTEANPVKVGITKLLRVPSGTAFPKMDFNFDVKAISVDDYPADDPVSPTNMPAIGAVTISYDGSETVTPVNNIMTIPNESGDIFDLKGTVWPHAGVYKYEITENTSTSFQIDDPIHEGIRYSPAKYTLTVYVQQGDTKLFIYAVGDVTTTPDNAGQTINAKVDPTPGGGEGQEYSQMIFTNSYVKTNGAPDPNNPDPTKPAETTLSVGKTISGPFASAEEYFQYTLTLAVPTILPSTPTIYRAYVVDGSGVINPSLNGTVAGTDSGGSYINFPSGSAIHFKLKDGQRLVFVDTPVGTGYTVNESGTTNYTPSVTIVYNSETPSTSIDGEKHQALSTGDRLVGEKINSADYVNTRDEVTPTGINLNDLPFIGMIVLAVVAVAGYVVFKSRGRRNYN